MGAHPAAAVRWWRRAPPTRTATATAHRGCGGVHGRIRALPPAGGVRRDSATASASTLRRRALRSRRVDAAPRDRGVGGGGREGPARRDAPAWRFFVIGEEWTMKSIGRDSRGGRCRFCRLRRRGGGGPRDRSERRSTARPGGTATTRTSSCCSPRALFGGAGLAPEVGLQGSHLGYDVGRGAAAYGRSAHPPARLPHADGQVGARVATRSEQDAVGGGSSRARAAGAGGDERAGELLGPRAGASGYRVVQLRL